MKKSKEKWMWHFLGQSKTKIMFDWEKWENFLILCKSQIKSNSFSAKNLLTEMNANVSDKFPMLSFYIFRVFLFNFSIFCIFFMSTRFEVYHYIYTFTFCLQITKNYVYTEREYHNHCLKQISTLNWFHWQNTAVKQNKMNDKIN